MKPLYTVFCAALLTGAGQSCLKPPCECEPEVMVDFECRIVTPQGQNLVFGPQALLKLDSIKVLKTRNDFRVHNASVRRAIDDTSGLRFDFNIPESKSFIYYNQQTASDSLEIEWVDKQSKCCGNPYAYASIRQVKFNGAVVQPQGGTYHLIKP